MKRALSVTWFAMRGLYDELFTMGAIGLIWFVVAIVVPYGLYYLGSLTGSLPVTIVAVLIALIPVPPITGALYSVAMHIARSERIEFAYFWDGFKAHFGSSWKIGGIVLVSGAILVIDASFYLSGDHILFTIVGILGLWALLFWATVQVYLLPLTLIQQEMRLRDILRNASLLTLAFPFFGLVILIVTILVTALSAVLIFLLATVWMPFVAILNCRATLSSMEEARAIQQRQAEVQEELQEEEDQE